MNWEALGAIGEIVGAVAVIATLGYLAVQIRQSTKAVRRSAHQSAVEALANTNSILIQDPEVSKLILRGLRHPEDLEDDERFRFDRWASTFVTKHESLFYQNRDGIIESERWGALEASMRELAVTRGFSDYWERRRHLYSPSYQEFIERLRSA